MKQAQKVSVLSYLICRSYFSYSFWLSYLSRLGAVVVGLTFVVSGLSFCTFPSLVPFRYLSSYAYADDTSQRADLARARELYAHRSNQSLDTVQEARSILSHIESLIQEPSLKYDVLVLGSKANYWIASHSNDDETRLAYYNEGAEKAELAKNLMPQFADAYYYYGTNVARREQIHGKITFMNYLSTIEAVMVSAMQHPARDGSPGKTIDGYGPSRFLGKLYFELPWPMGSIDSALADLTEAYENAPDVPMNTVFYAEVLHYVGDSWQRAHAIDLLDQLIAKKPEDFNPNRIPESENEIEQARVLRQNL